MSNAPEFGQGSGTLTRAAGLVSDARSDFTTISNKLTNQITGMQGRWAGDGARAFFVLHQTWSEKQKTIVDALDRFSESLTTTERDNVATDSDQGSNFANLTSRLG
ncbi:WXG100 family type VII secretion target [Nocardioides sp. R-C-SC26]|uniref:WXG100 family type VII secretion target n=1 Tax=Nocardioides sp. R-C-SC26 TaxID=2870414 RepID=UPI001E5E3CC5|nr:WXG100 family type VII secretion target [Nocardioides sp. R-C-SC26]